MTIVWVEISGEAPELARAEAVSAARVAGGRGATAEVALPPLLSLELPEGSDPGAFASRLALAHRVLVLLEPSFDPPAALARAGRSGRSAVIRRLGRPRSGGEDPSVLAGGAAYKRGGGTIDLDAPERRFWLVRLSEGSDRVFEEVAGVDRRATERRRMPTLPFQRPVSLPPKLARAAANLAGARPGARILDPFVGTGALLAEAGLLGAHLYGIDRDPTMVRGALRNLAHLGLEADELVAGDAGAVDFARPGVELDGILTDPPYGRSSGTGGEEASELVARVLPRWASRVRPEGRIVLIVPGGPTPLESPWQETARIPVRVHRSLTREFRVYERGP